MIGLKIKYIGDQGRVIVPDFGLKFAKPGLEGEGYENVRTVDTAVGKMLITTGQYVEVKKKGE